MNLIWWIYDYTFWNYLVYRFILKTELFGTFTAEENGLKFQRVNGEIVTDKPTKFLPLVIWALFGNATDGVIGDKHFNPEQKDTFWIRVKWWFRNPFHNLTWFIIGFADKPSVRFDFNQEEVEGWNKSFSLAGDSKKDKLYPFILYKRKRFTFYIGWRGRGNFGIKLNRS